MEEIFPALPELPTPVIRQRNAGPASAGKPTNPTAVVAGPTSSSSNTNPITRILQWLRSLGGTSKPAAPQVNTFLALKQGDRSLIVAVVDGGNVGWTRLGRGGFQEHVMVPNEML